MILKTKEHSGLVTVYSWFQQCELITGHSVNVSLCQSLDIVFSSNIVELKKKPGHSHDIDQDT